MKKTIFEEMGGTYIRHGDYLIPCLTLPEEEQRFIGVWGQRHLRYLKEYSRSVYLNLLTSGRLNDYLADIEEQAQERFERIAHWDNLPVLRSAPYSCANAFPNPLTAQFSLPEIFVLCL